jgi:hypothetical protein
MVKKGLWVLLLITLAYVSAQEQICSSPTTIFCSGFEEGNKDIWDDYDGNPDSTNLLMENPGPLNTNGNHIMRFRVPAGRGGSDLVKILPSQYDKVYARWYEKWEPGYDFSSPNHGGGLHAGDRNYLGSSDNRPQGNDWFGTWIEPTSGTGDLQSRLNLYSYYRGMYMDCADPNGACWGDHFPCMLDEGSGYCEKAVHRETIMPPKMETDRWYCIEIMLEAGTPVPSDALADGRQDFWIDGTEYGPFEHLWHRTTADVKVSLLWLSLFHHGEHSVEGVMFDNVVVSTQRIGCLAAGDQCSPVNIRCVDDTAGATQEYPTVQAAAAAAQPGDTVLVFDGVYNEEVSLSRSGTTGAKITLRATNPHKAVLHGFIGSASFVRIEGFNVTGTAQYDGTISVQGSNLEIIDNYFGQSRRYGITLTGNNNRIAGNTIYQPQIGITVMGANIIVEDNEITRLYSWGTLGDCDYSRFFGDNITFQKNHFYGTDFAEIGSAHVDCFQTFDDNGEHASDVMIFNNTCSEFHQGFMGEAHYHQNSRRITFMNNIFAHGGAWGLCVEDIADLVAVHNTFYDIYWYGVGVSSSQATGTVIKNNIFSGSMHETSITIASGASGIADYNLIYDAVAPYTVGTHNIVGSDPAFVNAAGNDFRLQSGSIACTGGEAGTYLGAIPCSGSVVRQCTHPANIDGDGIISNAELSSYLSRWRSGTATMVSSMDAISTWKKGCTT